MSALATPTRFIRATLGECGWLLVSVLMATSFVAAFVLLSDSPPRLDAVWAELARPVNVVRVVVFAAAMWIWAYIVRSIRAVEPDAAQR